MQTTFSNGVCKPLKVKYIFKVNISAIFMSAETELIKLKLLFSNCNVYFNVFDHLCLLSSTNIDNIFSLQPLR